MAIIARSFAALFLSVAALVPATAAGLRNDASRAPAQRFTTGSSVSVTVSARIVRAAARVGHGLGPPAHAMVPRSTTVSAADGRSVAAIVYDFE